MWVFPEEMKSILIISSSDTEKAETIRKERFRKEMVVIFK